MDANEFSSALKTGVDDVIDELVPLIIPSQQASIRIGNSVFSINVDDIVMKYGMDVVNNAAKLWGEKKSFKTSGVEKVQAYEHEVKHTITFKPLYSISNDYNSITGAFNTF